jgi:hypothetical protein
MGFAVPLMPASGVFGTFTPLSTISVHSGTSGTLESPTGQTPEILRDMIPAIINVIRILSLNMGKQWVNNKQINHTLQTICKVISLTD